MGCSQSLQNMMPPLMSLHKSLCIARRKQSGSFSLNKLSGIPVFNVSGSFSPMHLCVMQNLGQYLVLTTLSMCCWKVCLALFLISWSLSNRAFLNVWLISSTQMCQCQWSVFLPCFSSAPANACTVPNFPFPVEVLVLVSHLSIFSVNICITLWNSRDHAPGLLSLAFFLRTKSARQSSSEHFNKGNSCWVNRNIKYEHNIMVRN
jgi:hypothetical protein